MHIIGTAGHVDHGKSSLVNALTGTNPDRWLEEQVRGMTLDLGFAHLRFEDGTEAGIVDVPGHERFLHNMLAGAAGMELLLLVIAADEGVMPQTVEHLQILRFLDVRRTIVVASKADLLGDDELERAVTGLRESLRDTIAADTPVVAVSTRTGAGLDTLREHIHAALRELPQRNADAPVYLPVDRVFALAGHGTIVTGTLMQGILRTGDRVKLEPSGKTVRVRSLQVFGAPREHIEAGARVAANLPGVETDEIARGEVLASPQFVATDAFAVTFEALPDAAPLLHRRNPVRAYIGAAEILGTLLLGAPVAPGERVAAHLFLRRPTVAYPGSAFVVRRLSPKALLGGGRIEGAAGDVVASETLEPAALREQVSHEESILALVAARGIDALTPEQLARDANLREDVVAGALASLCERGLARALARPEAYVDAATAATLGARVAQSLSDAHRVEPWAMGMTSLSLARALGVTEPLLVRMLASFADEGLLVNRGGYYAAVDHTPTLTAGQVTFFEREIPIDSQQPFNPAELASVVAAVKRSPVPGIAKAFDTLVARGTLVKVGDHLYRGSQIAKIQAKVETFLRAEQEMTMAQFRDLLGTSRKFAVPLLEWFDARGITVRAGDYRRLRTRKDVTA